MVWMIFTFLFRDWCSDSLPRPWGRLLVFVVSWLTVKVRVWVAKLHTDQTVGSSVTNASFQ